jgi:ABC-2 type transport system permease protein
VTGTSELSHVAVQRAGADDLLEVINKRPTFFRGFASTAADVWSHRELLVNLVRKDVKVKYKDSVLGLFWSLARPLVYLLVYSIAIGWFLGASRYIQLFVIYLFTGLLAWGLFSEIINGATASVVGNAGLVKKVWFPRELLPLSAVGLALVNAGLQVIVLVGAYVVTGEYPTSSRILLIPLALAVTVVFATAIGLLLAAINVYLRDVQHIVEVLLLVWFWLTPIVYDWGRVRTFFITDHGMTWIFQLYLLNPMANVALAFQAGLWPGVDKPSGRLYEYDGNLTMRLSLCLVGSLALLWVCQRLFARMATSFAQEL